MAGTFGKYSGSLFTGSGSQSSLSLSNGTAASPSLLWTDIGFYRKTTKTLVLAIDSTDYMYMAKNGNTGLTLALGQEFSGLVVGADPNRTGFSNIPADATIIATSQAYNTGITALGFGTGLYPIYRTRHARGNMTTPTALTSGITFGLLAMNGYNGSSFPLASGVSIYGVTSQAWSVGNNGSELRIQVTPNSTATLIDAIIVDNAGNLAVNTAGTGLRVKEGSNAKQGTAVLVAGTVVVSNTSVTANSRIMLTSQVDGGTPGFLRISTRTASTSFTVTSSSGSDTSTVAYQIFEPA